MKSVISKIEASHRAAAARAVAFMDAVAKVELSPPHALDLVAVVLGVANWSTLKALAKQGRGPRVDEPPTPAELWAQAKLNLAKQAFDLAEQYGTETSWGQHPEHTRRKWRDEVADDETLLSYWEFVAARINAPDEDEDGSERDDTDAE